MAPDLSPRADVLDSPGEAVRAAALIAAEERALALLDAIETADLLQPGRSEREVERDIRQLAVEAFGVSRHWHKRIVRCGTNTLATAGDNPPVLTIGEDDIVFLDLGPVFDEWEADVGRSYAIGDDPAKHALCRDLPIVFDRVRRRYDDEADITGAGLFDHACAEAERLGWRFGGEIAGHVIAEFPHARMPGSKDLRVIAPANRARMRNLDTLGRVPYWILEIHLVSPDGGFGGFYERLLLPD